MALNSRKTIKDLFKKIELFEIDLQNDEQNIKTEEHIKHNRKFIAKINPLIESTNLPKPTKKSIKLIKTRNKLTNTNKLNQICGYSLSLQKVVLSLINQLINQQKCLTETSKNLQNSKKKIEIINPRLNHLERAFSEYWHPNITKQTILLNNIQVSARVKIKDSIWVFVKFSQNKHNQSFTNFFWTLESIYLNKINLCDENNDLNGHPMPKELSSYYKEKAFNNFEDKLQKIKKEYDKTIYSLINKAQNLEILLTKKTKEIDELKAQKTYKEIKQKEIIRRTDKDNSKDMTKDEIFNEEKPILNPNDKAKESEQLKKLIEILRKMESKTKQNEEKNGKNGILSVNLEDYQKLNRDILEKTKNNDLIKKEYNTFKIEAERIIKDKNKIIRDLTLKINRFNKIDGDGEALNSVKSVKDDEEINETLKIVGLEINKNVNDEINSGLEWNDHLEYLKNIIISFMKDQSLRKELFPVISRILRINNEEKENILKATENFNY